MTKMNKEDAQAYVNQVYSEFKEPFFLEITKRKYLKIKHKKDEFNINTDHGCRHNRYSIMARLEIELDNRYFLIFRSEKIYNQFQKLKSSTKPNNTDIIKINSVEENLRPILLNQINREKEKRKETLFEKCI
jgi:hypothetical protein